MHQRSPILFWLLLAATISVDAVAVLWLFDLKGGAESWREVDASNYLRAVSLYHALAIAGVSMVCIWAAFSRRMRFIRWIAIAITVAIAAMPLDWLAIRGFAGMAGYLGGQAILLALLLWVLRQSSYWQQQIGQAARNDWQFSIFDVLALTTGGAIVLGLLKHQNLLDAGWMALFLAGIMCNAGVAVAAVAIHAWRQPFWIRAAALMATALATAFALGYLPNRLTQYDLPTYLIQAVALLAWVEISGIVPSPMPTAAAAESDATASMQKHKE